MQALHSARQTSRGMLSNFQQFFTHCSLDILNLCAQVEQTWVRYTTEQLFILSIIGHRVHGHLTIESSYFTSTRTTQSHVHRFTRFIHKAVPQSGQ